MNNSPTFATAISIIPSHSFIYALSSYHSQFRGQEGSAAGAADVHRLRKRMDGYGTFLLPAQTVVANTNNMFGIPFGQPKSANVEIRSTPSGEYEGLKGRLENFNEIHLEVNGEKKVFANPKGWDIVITGGMLIK